VTYPATRSEPVVDILHGESIADPYRWLEDGTSPEVIAWTAAQNRHTAAILGAVPARDRIRARLTDLLAIGALGTPTPANGRYLHQERTGGQDQPVLYLRTGVGGQDAVVLDPNVLDTAGTTALDWYYPSPDGRLLAYGLSSGGSERSELRLLDLDRMTPLPEVIPHTRACDVAWLPDGSAFYYTRYPSPGEVPEGEEQYHRAIWHHVVGADVSSDRLIYQPAQKEHWPSVGLSDDGRWLMVGVARTFDQTDVRLLDRSTGEWITVVENLPHAFDGQVVRGTLYLRTNLDAPTYRVFAIAPERAADRTTWRELVPARPDAVLSSVTVTRQHLALDYLERASARLVLTSLQGNLIREEKLPTLGSLFGIGAEPDGMELFYGFTSFAVPPSIYRIDLRSGSTSLWKRVEADVHPERYAVRQVTYPSRDGTPISMFLVHETGLDRARPHPVYLTGYGGFNISLTPTFSRSLLLWLEHGGIVAIPNLRGGGEYGEAWHRGGMLANKQNTFDDFIAAAEWLGAEGYTTPALTAAAGGSNGGLLMGAVLTQRPDLFRAVVVQVPLLDMLRYHRFLIARLWLPEYGSPDDPGEFRWLRAYSPYHMVRDGEHYPAVLLATAGSDSRVDPLHARKMAARLQAAAAPGRPILLRIEADAGHGAGKPVSKVLEELTDTWSFIVQELGLGDRF
jgi:prolyl oligopeptidase